MNYGTAVNASVGGIIPVGDGQINVKNFGGPTQVIIDITGYYITPLTAWVGSDGSYQGGSRVVSLSHLGTGTYQVDFDRNVSKCSYSVTSFFFGDQVLAEPRGGDANGVFIGTINSGSYADDEFYLSVTC